jgi:uncharacterized Zn finger protein
MKCEYCGTEMKQLNLKHRGTQYHTVRNRTLYICNTCGNEKEVIGGEKFR